MKIIEKHLKSEQYYADRYDRQTVNWMRMKEKYFLETKIEKTGDKKIDEQKRVMREYIKELMFHFEKGEQYLKKSETIRKWMDEDRRRDELMDSAKDPEEIYCLYCNKVMQVETKSLYSGHLNAEEKVLFILRCADCRKGRAFFHTGEEWLPKPEHCDKCASVLKRLDKKTETKIMTEYHCPKCGIVKTDEMDLSVKIEEVDPDYEADKARFCITEKEGQDYLGFKISTEHIKELLEKHKEREENKEQYDKIDKIKKISIVELENILRPALEAIGFIKFEIKSPEAGRYFIVPFNARDEKPDRSEWDSKKQLEKVIKDTLNDTNWRLMSGGVNYRLGFIDGRLRAYEKEEDLLTLV